MHLRPPVPSHRTATPHMPREGVGDGQMLGGSPEPAGRRPFLGGRANKSWGRGTLASIGRPLSGLRNNRAAHSHPSHRAARPTGRLADRVASSRFAHSASPLPPSPVTLASRALPLSWWLSTRLGTAPTSQPSRRRASDARDPACPEAHSAGTAARPRRAPPSAISRCARGLPERTERSHYCCVLQWPRPAGRCRWPRQARISSASADPKHFHEEAAVSVVMALLLTTADQGNNPLNYAWSCEPALCTHRPHHLLPFQSVFVLVYAYRPPPGTDTWTMATWGEWRIGRSTSTW